jgi:broad specificity phosphatase PhoE
MATLYLIRHGEPELRGVFLGQMDSPLSAAGHAQAKAALQSLEVTLTYTSPLPRARQTAEYLTSRQIIEIQDLRELDYGEWTGKTWTEIETNWSDLASQKSADWLNITPPGGETWNELLQRVGAVWTIIHSGPEPCAVVAHQAVNAALASLLTQTDPLHFAQQYGEVLRIEYA